MNIDGQFLGDSEGIETQFWVCNLVVAFNKEKVLVLVGALLEDCEY